MKKLMFLHDIPPHPKDFFSFHLSIKGQPNPFFFFEKFHVNTWSMKFRLKPKPKSTYLSLGTEFDVMFICL